MTDKRKPDPTAPARQARARVRKAEKINMLLLTLRKIKDRTKEQWIRDEASEALAEWLASRTTDRE